jgi:hypothetical protein
MSCSEGPVAVQLQGNKDQSKKMAAMTTVDTLPTKDMSADEKKQGFSVAEKDETKEVNDARVQEAQIGLQEQQLEYKLRKEREYQAQLHRQAHQVTLHSCPIQDPDSFHSASPEFAGIWNCGRHSIPAKSRGHRICSEPCSPAEEDIDDFNSDDGFGATFRYSGASTSQASSCMFPVNQTEKSSTKTVRVGPGYSVLALPKPSQSSTATSESLSTWAEVSRGMSM